MGYRIGSGYKASANLQTSVANQEILPSPPNNWTISYQFYKFSLYNDQECHILINDDTEPKYLRAGQGFNINELDKEISSLKIVENGITFNWFGAW